uniref:Valine--tRNA ligase, mitochondrial n=1 Tax=Pygocentrus nattereri TaxID=42514 RepID=A0AAR2JDJ1_PYGNA
MVVNGEQIFLLWRPYNTLYVPPHHEWFKIICLWPKAIVNKQHCRYQVIYSLPFHVTFCEMAFTDNEHFDYPEYVESCWYPWWEKQGFFRPEKHLPQAVDRIFSLCIPPPNVTGTLHLGHALTVAIEDALARWRRMQGYKVLWVPGCDHAGIATQSVVERRLLREQDKRRQDYSREEFLQEVWRWKQEKGDEIYHQLKKLGASLDWSRACFTMDPGFSKAVTEAFVRMCDSGLIYRSESLVNWSCALESAISDIEVDSKQLPGRTLLSVPGYEQKVEFGTMITFAYPIEGHEGEVAVSTTRPETMLGDVAIAVHPDDTRYQVHISVLLILWSNSSSKFDSLHNRAVKLTPAHDHTDFLLSQRHSLPKVHRPIFPLISLSISFFLSPQGVKRFQARERVISINKGGHSHFASLNCYNPLITLANSNSHSTFCPVPHSRSGDVIEPLLKKQWFVRCEKMAQKAIQAVDEGELEIIPHFYTKTWKNWLSNISDWCISRQLWWGHQIPAYRVTLPESGNTQEVGLAEIREIIGSFVQLEHSYQLKDPDVLDTWFSSGLFPFAMLGWPEQTEDLKQFYPNTMLETGNDLIFFWVARMVMLGTELTGQLPFKQVLFHSLVRDKHGRKMSKSLGNVIDPLDVISGVSLERLQEKVMEGNLDPREKAVAMEAQRKDFPNGIPECGTDALRFALCSYKAQGEDISLSVSQVLSCRHFCNKMWQTVRFTLGALLDVGSPVTPVGLHDRCIVTYLCIDFKEALQGFESYELHTVTSALHSFWLHSLCDVYLECIKPVLKQQVTESEGERKVEKRVAAAVLYHCVSTSLRLLSPLMPFLTEELWQRLQPYSPRPSTASSSVCMQSYPTTSELAHWHFPQDEADFPLVQEVVRVARSLRAQYHLTKEKPDSECHDCVCLTCSGIFFSLLLCLPEKCAH